MGRTAQLPGSPSLVGQDDVPAVEAVLAAVEDNVAGMPAVVGLVATQMALPATIHTDDVVGHVHHGEGSAVWGTWRLVHDWCVGLGRYRAGMRIVAGTSGGRTLFAPPGEGVRPTTERVREAIFNSLYSHGEVEGRRFLDMFAGSGALGLEALSRGAAGCTFIDSDRACIEAISGNVERLGFGDVATVRRAEAMSALANLEHHDVALLDPPYDFDAWPDLVRDVPAGVLVIEASREVELGPGWRILKAKQYGGTVVTIARRTDEAPERTQQDGGS